jgi:hypothetical protein
LIDSKMPAVTAKKKNGVCGIERGRGEKDTQNRALVCRWRGAFLRISATLELHAYLRTYVYLRTLSTILLRRGTYWKSLTFKKKGRGLTTL